MTLFYFVILAMNISLLMSKDSGLEKLFLKIEKKRKPVIVITYIYIIFIGCFLFPISISKDSAYLFLMLISYFYIGIIFYGLYKKRPLFVFITTFLLNSMGLLSRVLLEWEEYSITRDLTQFNVGVYLTIIPLFITFIYCIIPIMRKVKH